MKYILCFGDSNTFGTDPIHGGRHGDEVRWPGALRRLLGKDYRVIEEGLGGRTTVFEDPIAVGKKGLDALTPCIASHNPLDLIIVMLGTNDLKHRYGLTAQDLGGAMARIVDEINRFPFEPVYPRPQILLISPVRIKSGISSTVYGSFTEEAVALSGCFAKEYRAVSEAKGCHFFDAALVCEASEEDKLHMTAQNHLKLAGALEKEVRKILK